MNYKNPITKETMKELKVRVTSRMRYELEFKSIEEDVSISEVVRRIIEEWMENDRRQ